MKKMVMACMCDVCGKQMDEKASRYAIRLGVGNWQNDVVQQTKEKDLCKECYEVVRDLLKYTDTPKNEVKVVENTDKKRGGGRRRSYDITKVEELYCNGWVNSRIERELGMSRGAIKPYIKDIEAKGLTRGQNLLPEYKETPVRMRTVVDGSGFVVNVN